MKNASDFRSLAREALSGKWALAILAGIVASVLGGIGTSGPEIEFKFEGGQFSADLMFADQTVFSTTGGFSPELQRLLVGGAIAIGIVSILFAVLYFVLGGFVAVGYSKFNLDLVDHKDAEIGAFFSYISYWKTTALANLLETLYVLLWSLLLIIPGIMASYSYAMKNYVLADHPELTANEAIARSKEMMRGNRFRLFCLDFSFIGWNILCMFTLGIGNLWLNPYIQASRAAFYREVSETEYRYEEDFYEDGVYEGEVI